MLLQSGFFALRSLSSIGHILHQVFNSMIYPFCSRVPNFPQDEITMWKMEVALSNFFAAFADDQTIKSGSDLDAKMNEFMLIACSDKSFKIDKNSLMEFVESERDVMYSYFFKNRHRGPDVFRISPSSLSLELKKWPQLSNYLKSMWSAKQR